MKVEYIERLKTSKLAELPPFMFATSPEVAKALGVHIQTLSNWRLREVGPPAAPSEWFRGRASRYQVGMLFSWAYEQAGLAIRPHEITRDWLKGYMGSGEWDNREKNWHQVQVMMRISRDFRPQDLTREGREGLGI